MRVAGLSVEPDAGVVRYGMVLGHRRDAPPWVNFAHLTSLTSKMRMTRANQLSFPNESWQTTTRPATTSGGKAHCDAYPVSRGRKYLTAPYGSKAACLEQAFASMVSHVLGS